MFFRYDRKDTSKIELLDVHLITALSPPGCGRNEITVRFVRHMNVIGMDSFDDETLRRIFTTEVDWHFKVKFKKIFHDFSTRYILKCKIRG